MVKIILGAPVFLLVIAAAYASFFIAPTNAAGPHLAYLLFSRWQCLGRAERIFPLLHCQPFVRLEAGAATTGWQSPPRKSAWHLQPSC